MARILAALGAADIVFFTQLNWYWAREWDAAWPLRLLAAPLVGGLLAWLVTALIERLRGHRHWPRLERLRARLGTRKALAWLLAGCALAAFLLAMGGRFYSSDDTRRYLTIQAMVERGELAIRYPPQNPPHIEKYGILQPLLALPLYLVGEQLVSDDPAMAKFDEVVTSTLMQVVTALTCAVMLLFLLDLGYSRRASLGTVMVFASATIAFPYAKFFFTAPLTGLTYLTAAWLLWRFRQRGRRRELFYAGLVLALGAVNAMAVLAVAALPVGVYLAVTCWPRPAGVCRTWRDTLACAAVFLAPLLVAVGWQLLFNWLRYDSPWITGYEHDRGFKNLIYNGENRFDAPWFWGLQGLLLSPGKSVFLYSPPLILALAAWGGFRRRRPAMAWLALGLCLTDLALYSKWWAWHGDLAWGPRYLVPITALAMLPLAEALEHWDLKGWGYKVFFAVLVAAGVAGQVLGTILPFDYYLANHLDPKFQNHHLFLYVPHFSPILGQVKMLAQAAHLDYYLLHYHLKLGPVLALLALALGQAAWLGATAPPPPGPPPRPRPLQA